MIYTFGEFRLDPLARELRRRHEHITLPASAFDCLVYLVEHRERPVGRDELISAVWGRTDVSDNLLAQTIVRLRRELGDAGSEQHTIRTIARVGYRWMVETAAEPSPKLSALAAGVKNAVDTSHNLPSPAASTNAQRSRPVGKYTPWIGLAGLLVVTIAGIGVYMRNVAAPQRAETAQAELNFNQGLTAVLPAQVSAPEQWAWLRFGLMALTSNQLRQAQVHTVPSETVVGWLGGQLDGKTGDFLLESRFGVSIQIQPYISLSNDKWTVRLEARASNHKLVQVQTTSGDVVGAANDAVDLLLIQFGQHAHANREKVMSEQELLLQHINAARFIGQFRLARQLLDNAPAHLRNLPENVFVAGVLDREQGNRAESKKKLTALLDRLPVETGTTSLRGRILIELAKTYSEDGEQQKSMDLLTESIQLLQQPTDQDRLATAYLARAYLAHTMFKPDAATSDLGRARMLFEATGNANGIARVDFQTGLVLQRRGQLEAALAMLNRADKEFAGTGMKEMLLPTLDGIALTQSLLLQFAAELATTDRYWPLDPASKNPELTLVRAFALADNGRISEASELAQKILRNADQGSDASLVAETQALLAKMSLMMEDNTGAVDASTLALTPALESDDPRDYASAWLVKIRALLRSNRIGEAETELRNMRAWPPAKLHSDEWINIYSDLANAELNWAKGRHDESLKYFSQTMEKAQKLGVPELIVDTGQSYAWAALESGHLEQAMAISGTLSPWANNDMRAAEVAAGVYKTLGQKAAWQASLQHAQELAGERVLRLAE